MGNKRLAIEFYDKAIELDTTFLIARKNLLQYKESKKTTAEDWTQEGRAYLEMKKFKEAVNCFKRATQLNPNERRYWFYLGFGFYKMNRCIDAIAYYIKANEIAPEADTYNNLAICYKNLKQFDKAHACYENALRIKPEDHVVLNNIGDNYYYQRDFQKALEYFQKSVEMNPMYALGWYNVGRVHTKLGDRSKTLDCWVRAMSIDPNLAVLRNDLTNMLIAHPRLKLELPPLEEKYNIQIRVKLKVRF
jgi:tetratricopeptide (TPR) repeat protein